MTSEAMRYLLSLLLCLPVAAATYYAHPTGTGSGTIGSPMSLTAAVNAAVAGDTVYLRGGTYTAEFRPVRSGTSGNPITFAAYESETPIIDGGLTRQDGIAMGSEAVRDYLVFDGITIQRAAKYGINLMNGTGLVFRDLHVRSNAPSGGQGLWIVRGTNITITGGTYEYNGNISSLRTSGNRGILVADGSTNVVITNTILRFNASDGAAFHANSESTPVRNSRLVDSQIYGNLRSGLITHRTHGLLLQGNTVWTNGATGFQLEKTTSRAYVRDNTVNSNSWNYQSESGIWLDENIFAVVESNRLSGNYRPLYGSQVHTNIWRRNVMWNNNAQLSSYVVNSGIGLFPGIHANDVGVVIPGGATNNLFLHNTIHDMGVSGSARGGWYTDTESRIRANWWLNNIISEGVGNTEGHINHVNRMSRVDFNIYHNSSRPIAFVYAGSTLNLAQWRSATTFDANSRTEDPQFVDIPGLDFNIKSNSPAIDRGGWLTTATSTGSGTTLAVVSVLPFQPGYAALGIDGDLIQLEGQTETARVTGVNYANNTLTLDTSLSWTSGDGVAYPYFGLAPDIGAYEYGATGTPPIITPPTYPLVSVEATDEIASEATGDTGTFTITRTETLTGTLTVNFTLSGTATEGTDYTAIGTSVQFADGDASTNILVSPQPNSTYIGNQTVILTLDEDAAYLLRQPISATITIIEGDLPPTVVLREQPKPGQSPATRSMRL